MTLTAAAVAFLSVHASLCGLPLSHAAPRDQEGELPRKGCLGARLVPLADDVRAREQLAPGPGVLIEAVLPNTTAAEGNLSPGDILLAVDGKPISSVTDPGPMVAAMTVGQQFVVTLARAGQRTSQAMMLKACPRDRGETFEVLYHHVFSGGARIRTIVTRPHTPDKHPVLFFIQGLGEWTVDRPLSEPDGYSRILHAFATSLNNLALLYYAQGKYAEAEPFFQRALAIVEEVLGPKHPDVATNLSNLAELYRAQGKYAEAEPLYQRALAIVEEVLEPKHPHVAIILENYVLLLQHTDRDEEAEHLKVRLGQAP